MKKIMIAIIVFALLFFGCVTVPSSGQNTKNDQAVPATSGGIASTGDELPPLPPDNEKVAGSVVANEELPPMPE